MSAVAVDVTDEAEFGSEAAIAELKTQGKDSRYSLTELETAWAKEMVAKILAAVPDKK